MGNQSTIEKLQSQIDLLMKERAERPADANPVAINLDALKAHLAVRKTMLPNHDISDLIKRADELDGDNLDPDKTGALVYAFDRFLAKNGPVVHEFAVPKELAENAHQHALDAKANKATPVVEEDDTEDDEESGKGEN